MPDIDWPSIRAHYEQGVSQRSLARKYGISQQAISKRALKESWVVSPFPAVVIDNVPDNQPLETSAAAIAEQARYVIAKAIQKMKEGTTALGPLTEYEDHKALKLLMDSLSQAHKIELTSTSDKPTESGLPADLLDYLSMADLDAISEHQKAVEAILDEARARKLETEQGIKTMRKTG